MGKIKQCKSCKRSIAWMKTSAGKNIPVDIDSVGLADKSDLAKGYNVIFNPGKGHKSHFATCPNANQHRRSLKPGETPPVPYKD